MHVWGAVNGCCHDGWRQVSVTARCDKKVKLWVPGRDKRVQGSKDWGRENWTRSDKWLGQSVNRGHLGRRKVLFPPSTVWGRGSVRGQEYDLWPYSKELLIHVQRGLLMLLSAKHDRFPITGSCSRHRYDKDVQIKHPHNLCNRCYTWLGKEKKN